MLQNSVYAISGTFYTLLNNTVLYLSYFILSYVFLRHNDSVEWGLTVFELECFANFNYELKAVCIRATQLMCHRWFYAKKKRETPRWWCVRNTIKHSGFSSTKWPERNGILLPKLVWPIERKKYSRAENLIFEITWTIYPTSHNNFW